MCTEISYNVLAGRIGYINTGSWNREENSLLIVHVLTSMK